MVSLRQLKESLREVTEKSVKSGEAVKSLIPKRSGTESTKDMCGGQSERNGGSGGVSRNVRQKVDATEAEHLTEGHEELDDADDSPPIEVDGLGDRHDSCNGGLFGGANACVDQRSERRNRRSGTGAAQEKLSPFYVQRPHHKSARETPPSGRLDDGGEQSRSHSGGVQPPEDASPLNEVSWHSSTHGHCHESS